MRRAVLYIRVILALAAVPAEKADIGRLLPTELISVNYRDGWVEIQTDTGNVGLGKDLRQAYENLKESASSEIFLDTADYLILMGESWQPDDLKQYLKPDIWVCTGEEGIDPAEAAMYLSIHKPKTRLEDSGSGEKMEHLVQTDTGFALQ